VNRSLSNLILVVFFASLYSCDPPNYIFEKAELFTEEKPWIYSDSLVYQFKIKDTSRYYHLLLEIDHNKKYHWENLNIKLNTRYPDMNTQSQIVSINLADETGEWYSDCRGKTCTFYLTLQEQAILPQMGNYQIVLYPWMRQDTIRDIYRIDFKVEKDGKRD
jgi:gliding motility-associated lipoprotein GldH